MSGADRVILTWGTPRSASTLVYNLARLALEQSGTPDLVLAWEGDLHQHRRGQNYLIKTHDPHPMLLAAADTIIFSYRDPRDAMVSGQRKFGTPPSLKLARWHADLCGRGLPRADLVLRFEDFASDPTAAAAEVLKTLDFDMDPQELVAALPASHVEERPAIGHDPVTLLHGGHRTGTGAGAWRRELPKGLQADIADELGDWLQKMGYPL
ncbi:MAG: hypothetical protein HKO57_05620 [Akkermansiaceae bacterium]|nr:hypothetical protein [Akkermansiaceae bacterium]